MMLPPFADDRDMSDRDQLINDHRDYARALARQIHKTLPRHVDFDDVAGYADVGLIQAAENFDREAGVAFKTFGYYRIRGAIFDGMRQMSGIPPKVREEMTIASGANAVEADVLEGAEPTDDPERLASRLSQVVTRTAVVVLLSQMGGADDRPLEESHDDTPAKAAEKMEIVQRLAAAVRQLPEDQAKLIELVYFRHTPLAECATLFNRNKSQMTRWHQAAIHALKEALSGQFAPSS
jgi:RNA polymerase sigma factor for flagellar operon FliA